MFLARWSSLYLPEALTFSYLNREWMTEWSHRQWLNLSVGWFQELRCTSFLMKATSRTSASATSATGRYSPHSSASPRAPSTPRHYPAMWLQSLPKKQQHRTILQRRNKENQAWPDQDSRCRWGRYGEPGTYPHPYPEFNCPFYTLPKFIHTHLSIPIG